MDFAYITDIYLNYNIYSYLSIKWISSALALKFITLGWKPFFTLSLTIKNSYCKCHFFSYPYIFLIAFRNQLLYKGSCYE